MKSGNRIGQIWLILELILKNDVQFCHNKKHELLEGKIITVTAE